MGNPSRMQSKESQAEQSGKDSLIRGSRRPMGPGSSALARRPSGSNLHQYLHTSNEILLHSQVAKLRIEEKYLSEEVETEGMERVALSHILSSVGQSESEMIRPLMPSPLGLRSDALAASG